MFPTEVRTPTLWLLAATPPLIRRLNVNSDQEKSECVLMCGVCSALNRL